MATVLHRFVSASLQTLGEREFRGNAASPDLQSDGYALDLRGGDLSRLQGAAAPLLWQHSTDAMIGRVTSIRATATAVPFSAQFLAPGASPVADKTCAELKGGAPYGVSLSFTIDKWEPLVPGRNAGRRATKWTALELSLCAIPIDKKAIVTERGRRALGAMASAMQACDRALDEHRAAGRHHRAMADGLERLDEHRRQGGTALRALRAALEAPDGELDQEHLNEALARCQRCVAGMGRELKAIGDRHADAMDAHSALMRAIREGEAAMNGTIQLSGGISESGGASRSANFQYRQRQTEMLRLAAPVESDDLLRRQREREALELAAVQY